MRVVASLLCVGLVACWGTEGRRAKSEELVRDRMEEHWKSAIDAREALIEGDLDKATAALGEVAKRFPREALAGDGEPHGTAVVTAATAGAAATDLTAAAEDFGQMAVHCGECHAVVKADVTADDPEAPPADPGIPSEMKRHHAAVEQIWLGLVRPSDTEVAAAVETLQTAPLVPTGTPAEADLPQRAAELEIGVHELASEVLRAQGEARGEAYGRLLTTCAVCHLVVREGKGGTP